MEKKGVEIIEKDKLQKIFDEVRHDFFSEDSFPADGLGDSVLDIKLKIDYLNHKRQSTADKITPLGNYLERLKRFLKIVPVLYSEDRGYYLKLLEIGKDSDFLDYLENNPEAKIDFIGENLKDLRKFIREDFILTSKRMVELENELGDIIEKLSYYTELLIEHSEREQEIDIGGFDGKRIFTSKYNLKTLKLIRNELLDSERICMENINRFSEAVLRFMKTRRYILLSTDKKTVGKDLGFIANVYDFKSEKFRRLYLKLYDITDKKLAEMRIGDREMFEMLGEDVAAKYDLFSDDLMVAIASTDSVSEKYLNLADLYHSDNFLKFVHDEKFISSLCDIVVRSFAINCFDIRAENIVFDFIKKKLFIVDLLEKSSWGKMYIMFKHNIDAINDDYRIRPTTYVGVRFFEDANNLLKLISDMFFIGELNSMWSKKKCASVSCEGREGRPILIDIFNTVARIPESECIMLESINRAAGYFIELYTKTSDSKKLENIKTALMRLVKINSIIENNSHRSIFTAATNEKLSSFLLGIDMAKCEEGAALEPYFESSKPSLELSDYHAIESIPFFGRTFLKPALNSGLESEIIDLFKDEGCSPAASADSIDVRKYEEPEVSSAILSCRDSDYIASFATLHRNFTDSHGFIKKASKNSYINC